MPYDVIIFDDDPYFAALVIEILGDKGLRVVHYEDGTDALEHIRRESPKIVIADIVMPGLGGISICKAVKNDPELSRRTKVAVVTGKHVEARMLALQAQADLFCSKPLDIAFFQREVCSLAA